MKTKIGWEPFEKKGFTSDLFGSEKLTGELWQNNLFTVVVDQVLSEERGDAQNAWVLVIANNDGSARHDWRSFQRIKNELTGPESEAIELYPAESRLVDTSNEFFLWVFDRKIDLGFAKRSVSLGGGCVKQRPWREGCEPKELRECSS